MNREKKNRVGGVLGTILFHAGLLMLLIFLALRTPLPLPEEEGVIVNLGFDEYGSGLEQRQQPAPAEQSPPPPVPDQQETQEEELLAQDTEEAPAIQDKKEEEKKKEPEEIRAEPVKKPVEEVKEPKPEPVPKTNPRALYKGKSTTSEEGGQEGQTEKQGDQGNPNGTEGIPNYDGQGGDGDGISYSLGGRGALNLHKPAYDSKEQGKVVVTIKVDRKGNVTSASAGAKGTNVSDQTLWQVARNAALKSKFQEDQNAPDLQVGTITYNFIRQN